MNDVNLPLSGGDNPVSPERRQLLRAASTLVAGAALFDGAHAQPASPAPPYRSRASRRNASRRAAASRSTPSKAAAARRCCCCTARR